MIILKKVLILGLQTIWNIVLSSLNTQFFLYLD